MEAGLTCKMLALAAIPYSVLGSPWAEPALVGQILPSQGAAGPVLLVVGSPEAAPPSRVLLPAGSAVRAAAVEPTPAAVAAVAAPEGWGLLPLRSLAERVALGGLTTSRESCGPTQAEAAAVPSPALALVRQLRAVATAAQPRRPAQARRPIQGAAAAAAELPVGERRAGMEDRES